MSKKSKQIRIALRNCGFINPININEYIAFDGYQALAKVLLEYTPDQVIGIVKESGLRGRGGGGFSAGLKWQLTRATEAEKNILYVMRMKEILVHLWIALYWKETLIQCWKPWQLQDMQLELTLESFIYVLNIH